MVPGASGQPCGSVQFTPETRLLSVQMALKLEIEQAKVVAEDAAGKIAQIKDQWASAHVPAAGPLAAVDMVEMVSGILCGPENYRRKKRKFKKLRAAMADPSLTCR